jgi:glucose-6-phosphate dehydrogenase assembly protein OpcA
LQNRYKKLIEKEPIVSVQKTNIAIFMTPEQVGSSVMLAALCHEASPSFHQHGERIELRAVVAQCVADGAAQIEKSRALVSQRVKHLLVARVNQIERIIAKVMMPTRWVRAFWSFGRICADHRKLLNFMKVLSGRITFFAKAPSY